MPLSLLLWSFLELENEKNQYWLNIEEGLANKSEVLVHFQVGSQLACITRVIVKRGLLGLFFGSFLGRSPRGWPG
ncbi:hypothetical protein AHAS_Ahas07G0144200 [Arachis hypogaea]